MDNKKISNIFFAVAGVVALHALRVWHHFQNAIEGQEPVTQAVDSSVMFVESVVFGFCIYRGVKHRRKYNRELKENEIDMGDSNILDDGGAFKNQNLS